MRSEAPASEQESAENQEVSSSRKCSGCQKETKNHFGPYGKKCCVVYLVDSLRLRVELLEEKLVESEKRHGKEMKEQSALHQKRIDGLLALVESLQEASVDRRNESNPASLVEDGEETSPSSSQASADDTPAAIQAQSKSAHTPASGRHVQAQQPEILEKRDQGKEKEVQKAEIRGKVKSKSEGDDNEGFFFPSRRRKDSSPQMQDHEPTPSSAGTSTPCVSDQKVNPVNSQIHDDTRMPGTCHSETTQGDNGWITQRRRGSKRNLATSAASRLTGSRPATSGSSGLYGSRRVSSKPLHLSYLGPDCNPADVIRYCKERRVTVTGCYFIRTRIWGTQSAKVYVDDSSLETVLRDSFWPTLVECRRWETTPPANKRFESSKAMEENPPERTSRGKSVPQ